ncbi:hypothetical protein N0V95_001427 [Ascochyta clinopodiicola]|nr:hypothetical protein N0V95_001427 [Ascochyta clinopodiicola]
MAQRESLGLLYLPIELLDAVVSLLDQPSHRALALTCKAANAFASRALYATYINRDAPSKAPFHLFLRTLCERPELAAMVKELDIRGWRSEFEVATGAPWQGVTKPREQDKLRTKRTGPLFVSVSRPATKALKSLKLFEKTSVRIGLISADDTSSVSALKKTVIVGSTLKKREDFARLLKHGVEDAHVVLMLALLPSIVNLCIDGMPVYSILDWHYFLKDQRTALRALSGLRICGQVTRYDAPIHTTTLRFLEFIPGLEHLELSHVSVEAPRQVTNLLTNKKLKCFFALETQIDGPMLRSILFEQRLEFFYYKPGGENLPVTHQDKFSEDHIVNCLAASRQSLKGLKLYATQPSRSPLTSHFDNLEVMEMPFATDLFNFTGDQGDVVDSLRKRIPNSLSTLYLRYVVPSEAIAAVLAVLVDLKQQGEFSELKTVRLNFCRFAISPWFPPVPYNILNPALEKELMGMFDNAGLQLEVTQTD